ncbi:unnamed protein product [Calicophoron daubneyi]|uniref:Uncharacterized protein n=1 Tax=Calicophoron daubneyi TaxID=300641 RepID=A0AAV2U1F8_CALDB
MVISSQTTPTMSNRARVKEQEIQIQMKPLVLTSDNTDSRQSEIDYIEGTSFSQQSFSSSRKHHKPFASDDTSAQAGPQNSNGQYASMLAERAHDAAIFGQLTTPPPSTALGSDPTESKERIVSSVDTVKRLIHPRLDKSDGSVWQTWLVRLSELKQARAEALSAQSQRKRTNGLTGTTT